MILWPHFTGNVYLWPGDVAVHINSTGHHDHASRIDRRASGIYATIDPSLHVNISHFAIDIVDAGS